MMTRDQQALADLMSELSEKCYCAGWMMGTEFTLWQMVEGGRREWGIDIVTEEEVTELKRLAEQIGGWIRWVDVTEVPRPEMAGELFVPMAEWKALFDAEASTFWKGK